MAPGPGKPENWRQRWSAFTGPREHTTILVALGSRAGPHPEAVFSAMLGTSQPAKLFGEGQGFSRPSEGHKHRGVQERLADHPVMVERDAT